MYEFIMQPIPWWGIAVLAIILFQSQQSLRRSMNWFHLDMRVRYRYLKRQIENLKGGQVRTDIDVDFNPPPYEDPPTHRG